MYNVLSLLFLFVYIIIWFACFVCICITTCILLANKWATLWAAYLGCAKLALRHGASSRVTIHCQGGMLKDAMTGLIASRLFVSCCWLISIGHGLSFIYFGWYHKGLLVFGTEKRITLALELFATTIWLV